MSVGAIYQDVNFLIEMSENGDIANRAFPYEFGMIEQEDGRDVQVRKMVGAEDVFLIWLDFFLTNDFPSDKNHEEKTTTPYLV